MQCVSKIPVCRNCALCITHYAFSAVPWIAFLMSLIVYWLTVDPGASYWDCPEYLIVALKLEVGHPPGNPGWALVHRVASSLFPEPAVQVRVVNMMSGLFTSLAVMMLCSVSVSLMRWIWARKGRGIWRAIAISLSSLAGSLCFAWSDSAWYSAVEAEVYAMSLFLSSLTVWMALKWTFCFGSAGRIRWIVALFYVIGFSLGVHQLNLLALPAIAMIMAFRRRGARKVGFIRVFLAFLAGCAAVGIILKVMMPGSLALAGMADLFAVNSLRLPYWSGALMFWSLALTIVVSLAAVTGRRLRWLSIAMWCLGAMMTGYSVYILIPVRAWANPPVNEGNPSDVFRFADYLERRQYRQSPIFYGRTPYSRIMRMERISVNALGDTVRDYSWNAMKLLGRDMRPMVKDGRIPDRSRFLTEEDRMHNALIAADSVSEGYVVAGFHTEPLFTPELNMWFPRIHASSLSDIEAYSDWTGMDSASMVKVRISEAFDSIGHPVPMRDASGKPILRYSMRPGYLQSVMYLLGYQVGYMYLRYLMWNYAGRQNDISSTGEIDHGNFITGISFLDDLMLGPQSELPPELGKENKGHNVYWSIPFIFGIIGIIWLFVGSGKLSVKVRMHRAAWVTLVLFLMTGMAIVFYLNQTPGEPRERDYSFMGSFWSFAIWISFGMLWMLHAVRLRWLRVIASVAVCSVPAWMLVENWDDHDRSGRTATLDYASNLLESLDEDAILFVDGDNFIFPLWFAQEVMEVRRDVTVVCNAYLPCDWYVRQLMTPRYEYDGLKMTATEGDVALGNCNMVRFPFADGDTVRAVDALKGLYSDISPIQSFGSRYILMGRDSADSWTFDLFSVPGKGAGSIAGLGDLAMIDIVATNSASRYPRPVYWNQALQKNRYGGFFPYTRQALFARRLMPQIPDSVALLDESLNVLPMLKWGGIDRMSYPGVDLSSQAALQRASLIRLAGALADAGRHDQALHIAKSAIVRYPSDVIPFGIHTHIDSVYFEARQLVRILRLAGEAVSDSSALSLADSIEKSDSLRVISYRSFRQALPSARRSAISPDSRNHSISLSR